MKRPDVKKQATPVEVCPMTKLTAMKSLLLITALLTVVLSSSCSTVKVLPPEVNLMSVDVRDVTLSHVNLLADIRVFNPNANSVAVKGVDYTLYLEGIKVFSGGNNQTIMIKPQEYGFITLRLSSAYWDIIELLNRLPDKTDVAFSMRGSVRVGSGHILSRRFSFEKEGIIPLQKTIQ
jgi:LEA14-like dessication related protein